MRKWLDLEKIDKKKFIGKGRVEQKKKNNQKIKLGQLVWLAHGRGRRKNWWPSSHVHPQLVQSWELASSLWLWVGHIKKKNPTNLGLLHITSTKANVSTHSTLVWLVTKVSPPITFPTIVPIAHHIVPPQFKVPPPHHMSPYVSNLILYLQQFFLQ